MTSQPPARPSHWRRNRALYLLIVVSLSPIVASYFAYYVMPPSGRTNYGTLIEPQRPVPALAATQLDGVPFDLRALRDQWVMVMADGGACDEQCRAKLLQMRQQRTMTGKERDAIERVWFVIDREPVDPALLRDYEGTHVVRIDARALQPLLPLPGTPGADLRDHIWLVDPPGNVMLRWPRDPDPKAMKNDIARLLRASSFWTRIERPKD
jgi:cytochrome oxidase Cu insertion factor (SCO1/SenC/PrrC family)